MHRRQILSASAVAGLACVLAAAASAQPPGAGALAPPPQAKVGASAASATVKAGEGGGPPGAPATLEEAFAACDMGAVLRLGGGQARDAMRVFIGKGQMARATDPASGIWTRTRTGFALSHLEYGERYDATPNPAAGYDPFDGWTPPNIAALPDADLLGPLPPGGVSTYVTNTQAAMGVTLGRNALSGMSAPDAAKAYYATMPELVSEFWVYDMSQSYYARCTANPGRPNEAPAVCLRTPTWRNEGQEISQPRMLMDAAGPLDPQKFPGYAALPGVNDPRPELKIPAEVVRRRALPPPPPGRQPPRNC